MELYFSDYIGGDDRLGEDVGEILSQADGVYSLDISSGEVSEGAQGIEIALITDDRHHVYSESF